MRSPRSVEALGRVDVVCIDKTGTLSENRLLVARVNAAPECNDDVLAHVLAASAPASDGRLEHATDHAVAAAAQSIVEALRRPRRHRRTIGLPRFRQPNRFQGKPSRSTATLKPRSNTSPAPHDLTPPAGDVATAVFVRCGSADVWVSRSRSRAARVSGWVWRTCQAFGRIATERLVACPPRSRTCRWTRSVLCRVTSSTRRTVRVRSRCGVSGLDQSVGKSVAKERIDLSLRSSVRRLLRPRWRVGSPRARFAGPVGRHSSRLPGWRRRAGLSGATAR